MLHILHQVYVGILALAVPLVFINLRRRMPLPLLFFAILLLYTAMVEISIFVRAQVVGHVSNNVQLYNTFMLVEFLAYAYFFLLLVQSRPARQAIKAFLYAYPVFWYFVVFFVYEPNEWNSHVYTVGALFTVLWAVIFCYETFTSADVVSYRRYSEFWIAVGLIFFYTCGLPYMGMFNYLTRHHMDVALILRHVLLVANIIMYSLFCYAYVCQLINTRKSSS